MPGHKAIPFGNHIIGLPVGVGDRGAAAIDPCSIYTLDQFTGADGTLITARPMDTGELWTAQVNDFAIRTNQAVGNAFAAWNIDTVTLPSADISLEVAFTENEIWGDSLAPAVIGRYTDPNNYWIIRPGTGGNGFRIIEWNAGVETVRAFSNTVPVLGTEYTLRVVFNGSTITATFQGVNISYASATLNQTSKVFGMRAWGANQAPWLAQTDFFNYFLAWPCSGSPPPNPIYPFSLTSPVPYEVMQRAGVTGSIPVTGTIAAGSGTHDIEASFNGGAYATIANSVSGAFSGTLANQAQGQGTLRVRFVDDVSRYEDVAYVGISDNFPGTGQSNMCGGMTNGQVYAHASLKAAMFGNDYNWKDLSDPTDSNSGQVDMVSYDGNQAGSYIPLLATSYMAGVGLPFGYIPCALYACSITDWLPGVDHEDRATLYGSLVHRVRQCGGCKVVLFHQGETDANSAMPQATYQAHMATLAAAIATDLGVKLMPAKIHYWTSAPSTPAAQIDAINNAIDYEWNNDPNVLPGPDMGNPNITTDLHIASDAEGADAAGRWWAALQAAFGW